jgi:hypothetical protein
MRFASHVARAAVIGLTIAAASAQAVTVNFSNRGTFTATVLSESGVTITAERPPGTAGTLYFLNFNGLGVVGGIADSIVDTGELVRFAFDPTKEAIGVTLFASSVVTADGDANFGEHTLTAVAGPTSLGTVNVLSQDAGPIDISARFSNRPITTFTFAPAGDAFRFAYISFTLQDPERRWANPLSGLWSTASNWDIGVPYEYARVFITPASGVRVTGPSSNTTIRELTVDAASSGTTILASGGGDLEVSSTVTIGPRGVIELGGTQLLRAQGGLLNAGVLRGAGQVDARLFNEAGGRVTIDTGQRIEFTSSGSSSNAGTLEVNGGETRFTSLLVNSVGTGTITGRDATLRFDGGLSNQGSLFLTTGVSEVFGNVANQGSIALGARAEAIFHDDFEQAGTFVIPTNAVATMFGRYTGLGFTGGGELVVIGTLSPGFSPAIADFDGDLTLGPGSTTIIDIEGLTPGQFDVMNFSGRALLDGTLEVLPAGGFSFARGQSFQFLTALGGVSGQFTGLGDGALVGTFGGVDVFIDYGANDVVLFTAPVPEPGTWALMAVGLMGVAGYARRRAKLAA